jgi:ABC-type oligopeptide transport system ATPase subunit
MTTPILSVSDLCVHYRCLDRACGTPGFFVALDNVSVNINEREIVGLAGESGCGKSTLARSVMGLVPVCGGSIRIQGRDITAFSRSRLRAVRPVVQMIFQDPYSSLNPRMTVFDAITEPLRFLGGLGNKEVPGAVSGLLDLVGLASRLSRKYPHEFSGGQRQRIAIARALAADPKLIIADEPVSALDISIQAQILNLLSDLSKNMGLAILFISHDMSVIRYLCRRLYVMRRGKIIEEGESEAVFAAPSHPYTGELIRAVSPPAQIISR